MTTKKQQTGLTKRQKEILAFIKKEIHAGRPAPTVRQIGNAHGIRSPNGVMCHLKALEKKGVIVRTGHVSRGIELVGPTPMSVVRALRKKMPALDAASDVTVTLPQQLVADVLELTTT